MRLIPFFRLLKKKKKSTHFIKDVKGLSFLDNELFKTDKFALDTEFDWRTTYFPRLSIIQISAKNKLFLIDCLKIDPKSVLKKYLENEGILKVFHSARSDTTVLSNCLNCQTKNVFDIQVADSILSKSGINSYAKIVNKFFAIELKKSETNSNWLKRPLTDHQIKYALEDVDFLLEIFNHQYRKLQKRNLLEHAFSKSEKEASLGNQSLKELRLIKQGNKLNKLIKEIFLWREEVAEKENVPPSFIFKDKHLKKLSKIELKEANAKSRIMAIIGDTQLTEKFMASFL